MRPLGDVPPEFGSKTALHALSRIDRWETYIGEAAKRFAIPQQWIRAVMRSESGGRTMLNGQPITSVAGAMGLMQLMPGTYSDMRQRYGFGSDYYDPHDNVLAGAAYLRLMYQQYGYPGLFAAIMPAPRASTAICCAENRCRAPRFPMSAVSLPVLKRRWRGVVLPTRTLRQVQLFPSPIAIALCQSRGFSSL
jgi:hypothetical protein